MLESEVYVKTDAGRDEIRSRALGLPMAVRAILLMVDGQRDVSSMRALIAGSKAPSDVLETLVARGLIESRAGSAAAGAPVPPATTPGIPTVPAVPVAPPPTVVYDGPIDLVLPTIYGDDAANRAPPQPQPQPQPVADVPGEPRGPVALDRYEHLYTMMNEIVRDFLAPHRRYFIQLKIERCTTPDELLELLHDLQTALAKARGEAFASEVIARVRSAAH